MIVVAALALAGPRLEPWTGETDVELFSAVITAGSCAVRMADEGNLGIVWTCPPVETYHSFFGLYEPVEGLAYYVDEGTIPTYELEAGFAGAIDLTGRVIGARGGVPVVVVDSYTIRPRPKPGAFKGCL